MGFFQIAISLLAYLATFSGQLYFWRSNFFTPFHTSTQLLLFRRRYFFRTAAFSPFSKQLLFRSSYFFGNSFFFRAKFLQNSPFLRTGSSLWQLLFELAIFSEKLFKIKISKEELLFQSSYLCTASTFSEKLHFEKN